MTRNDQTSDRVQFLICSATSEISTICLFVTRLSIFGSFRHNRLRVIRYLRGTLGYLNPVMQLTTISSRSCGCHVYYLQMSVLYEIVIQPVQKKGFIFIFDFICLFSLTLARLFSPGLDINAAKSLFSAITNCAEWYAVLLPTAITSVETT